MSIIVQIQIFGNDTETLDEKVKKFYKTSVYDVVKEANHNSHNAYDVEIFKGKVVKTESVNLGWFDDYRPGLKAVAFEDGIIKSACVSTEYVPYTCEKDADDATINAYNAKIKYNKRKAYIQKRLDDRKAFMELGNEIGFTYHDMKKLKDVVGDDYYYEAFALLKSFKNETLRSQFRKSLAAQIYNWMTDPAPQYSTPLSPKQLQFLKPYKPY